MKNRSPLFRLGLAAVAASTVCLGTPWIVSAQNAPATTAPAPAQPAPSAIPATVLPSGAAEVLKLHQGGINKDIITSYISTTMQPCHLSADGIIYLQGAGVPMDVIKALLQRDSELQQHNQARMQYYAQQQQMPPQQPPQNPGYAPQAAYPPQQPVQVVQAQPAPSVTVIGSDYPASYYYDGYGYPYYGAYGYWPGYVGLGWGWGGYGFRGGFGGFRGGFHGGGGGFHGGGGHGGGGHGGGHR